MKKWLSLVLCAMMLLGALPTLAAAEGELAPLEISVAVWDIENAKLDAAEPDAILKMVQEKFNVTFVPMNVGWGDYTDKYTTWAAGGSLPDISGGIDWAAGSGTYYQWIEDGVVRALPKDLSKYPNVEKYVNLPEVQSLAVDGENYIFPRMTYSDSSYWCMDRGLMIRKDWLENLGLEMPTKKEDLLPIMQAFTENDPDGNGKKDTIGFGYEQVFPTSQHFACFGDTDSRWMKNEEGVWVKPQFEATTIPLMDMLRTAYKNGWMDQDFAARNPKDVQEMFASGQIGILGKQNTPKHVKQIYDTWVVNQPDIAFEDAVALVPFDDPDSVAFSEKSFWSETYVAGNVDDEKLERILMIMDYLYSDEGFMLMTYGIEGTDYTVDAEGNVTITRPMNAEGNNFVALSDVYPSTGCFGQLAQWNGDLSQYIEPTIPEVIREMCIVERDRRIATWKPMNVDWEVWDLNVPEKFELSADVKAWSKVIADTSDATTEELYQQLLTEWNAQGYEACKKAITEAAAAIGK